MASHYYLLGGLIIPLNEPRINLKSPGTDALVKRAVFDDIYSRQTRRKSPTRTGLTVKCISQLVKPFLEEQGERERERAEKAAPFSFVCLWYPSV